MKSRTALILIVLSVSFALGASLTAAQDEGASVTASVTMVLSVAPDTLDPHTAPHPSHAAVLPYIFDTLVHQDETGAIVPYLAESWDAEDGGQTIVFHLRDDVLFSNGNPVNADAVIFTFQRLQEVGQRSFIYGDVMNIAAMEKVDDYTVRFSLRAPSVTLLSALSYTWGGIIDPQGAASAGEDFGRFPVGSGPFMVGGWDAESNITLAANPYYAGQHPTDDPEMATNVSEIVIRFTTDQATRVNALLAGEVDMAYITSGAQLARVAGNADFTVLDDASRGLAIFGFNTGRPPFDNVLMRQAVARAVDKQVLLDIAAPDGLGVIVNSPIAPSIWGYNPELEAEALGYDLEAARQLVEEARYDGAPVIILTSDFPPQPTMATVLQAQLAEVGIQAEIQVVDFAGSRAQAGAGEFDILVTRYNWNDPDLLRLYLAAENIGGANYYAYANPELDALTAQGRVEFNAEARFALYTEAQRIVMQDAPWIPLYMPVNKVIVNTSRIANAFMLHSYIVLDDATVNQ